MTRSLPAYRSVLAEYAHPGAHPELAAVRDRLRDLAVLRRFPRRCDRAGALPQIGTRTPVLSDDGGDLAAAVQTIIEAGFDDLARAVADAFDGATVSVAVHDGLFDLQLHQRGMLRPLRAAELSDGTLRFLLWAAALLSPQPPSLMVLNEPETSLHPDLVRPLASMIRAPPRTDTGRRRHPLERDAGIPRHATRRRRGREASRWRSRCTRSSGETRIEGLGHAHAPPWDWGKR